MSMPLLEVACTTRQWSIRRSRANPPRNRAAPCYASEDDLRDTDQARQSSCQVYRYMASTSPDYPRLRQTVLDTPHPRRLAEFYRELLGYEYRPGDAPCSPDEAPEWLVLRDDAGTPRLAFQLSADMPTPRWPTGSPPQMLHLDLTVDSIDALEHQRNRATSLGAHLLLDKSEDEVEPLYVFSDPSGHPFCIFVSTHPST